MRTTVNIQDEALELCKKKAEEKGLSLGDVISEAVFTAYRDKPSRPRTKPVRLPESGRGGIQPGVDLDSTEELEDVLDGRS